MECSQEDRPAISLKSAKAHASPQVVGAAATFLERGGVQAIARMSDASQRKDLAVQLTRFFHHRFGSIVTAGRP
jgi:hypothetical protein